MASLAYALCRRDVSRGQEEERGEDDAPHGRPVRVLGSNTVPYMMIQRGFSPPLAGGWTTAKSSLESGMIDGSAMMPIAASATNSQPPAATAPAPAVTAAPAAAPTKHPPLAANAPTSGGPIAAHLAHFPPLNVWTPPIFLPSPPPQHLFS